MMLIVDISKPETLLFGSRKAALIYKYKDIHRDAKQERCFLYHKSSPEHLVHRHAEKAKAGTCANNWRVRKHVDQRPERWSLFAPSTSRLEAWIPKHDSCSLESTSCDAT